MSGKTTPLLGEKRRSFFTLQGPRRSRPPPWAGFLNKQKPIPARAPFFLLRALATGRQPFLECGRKYQHAAMRLTKEGSLEERRLHLRYTAHKALPLAGLMDFGAVTPETVASAGVTFTL